MCRTGLAICYSHSGAALAAHQGVVPRLPRAEVSSVNERLLCAFTGGQHLLRPLHYIFHTRRIHTLRVLALREALATWGRTGSASDQNLYHDTTHDGKVLPSQLEYRNSNEYWNNRFRNSIYSMNYFVVRVRPGCNKLWEQLRSENTLLDPTGLKGPEILAGFQRVCCLVTGQHRSTIYFLYNTEVQYNSIAQPWAWFNTQQVPMSLG